MKNQMLITALTLTLISGFSAQAANRTAVTAPAVAVQTGEVKTLDLEQVTTQVSPEMRAALEQIQAQALEQAKATWDVKTNKAARMGSGKVSMQDFSWGQSQTSSNGNPFKEAKLTMRALEGGGYEVSNPSSGERIKISLGVSFKPLTITLTVTL